MPILTQSARVVLAESVALRPIHVAWGLGDGAWITPPSENPAAASLINEVGRRAASRVGYVVADPAGAIVLPGGRFTDSLTPTNILLVEVTFDFTDEPSQVIREFAVVVGSTMVAGLPAGQRYFTPAQVATPGRLFHMENTAPIYRSPAIRPGYKTVITF